MLFLEHEAATMKFFAALFLCLSSTVQAFAPAVSLQHQRATMLALDMARRPFISGNWKLNPQTRDEAVTLATDIAASITPNSPDADVALFVPYVFIDAVMGAVGGKLEVGAEVSIAINWAAYMGRSPGSLELILARLFSLSTTRASVHKLRVHLLVPSLRPCSSPLVSNGRSLVTRSDV